MAASHSRILSVFGTRPEAIKMAPVALALEAQEGIEAQICVTGQHRQMLDPVMSLFGLEATYDLDIMKPNQDLYDVTSGVLLGMRQVLRSSQPAAVLVHGDTTTCLAAGLAAFYERIPVGHVEAGLRTGDLRAPFPEEANRVLVDKISQWHFAPTESARDNLLADQISPESVLVTGNTVIDALLIARDKLKGFSSEYWQSVFGDKVYAAACSSPGKTVLITGHRRENFGRGFKNACNAICELARRHSDWNFVYPVHLNPNVRKPVFELLASQSNIHLIEPQDYLHFVWLMVNADLILTDSGGVQEEGPSLGKPVLVMRDVTERPEAVDAGTVMLVGTDTRKIISAVETTLTDDACYERMAKAANPYGDGNASRRILEALATARSSQGEELK